MEEEGQVEGGLDTDRDEEVSDEEGEDLMEVCACVLTCGPIYMSGGDSDAALRRLCGSGVVCVNNEMGPPPGEPPIIHPPTPTTQQNMEADYVAIPELDTYDLGNLDAREYGAMDMDARRAAEEEIARR